MSGLEARRAEKCLALASARAELSAPPGLAGYFLPFFDFLAFFAFFAFFAFLAIVSSQGLMDGNATRGMLGGGPASQYPRTQSQQIRGALPPPSHRCHPVIHSCYAFCQQNTTDHTTTPTKLGALTRCAPHQG